MDWFSRHGGLAGWLALLLKITSKCSRATSLSATSSTSGSRSTSPREAAVTAERSLDEAANGLGVMEII